MKAVANEVFDLPNGRYKGKWSGRIVTVYRPDGTTMELEVKEPLRGMGIPCQVVVMDNSATITSLQ